MTNNPDFDTLIGAPAAPPRVKTRKSHGLRLESGHWRAVFLTSMLALTFSVLVGMSFLFTSSGLTSVFPGLREQKIAAPSLASHFEDSYASGPVVFWDKAVVICRTSVTAPTVTAQADFECDWTTFDEHFTGFIDHRFQKLVDVRVGVIDHRRVAGVEVIGTPTGAVDSYQPLPPDLSNPDVTWADPNSLPRIKTPAALPTNQ